MDKIKYKVYVKSLKMIMDVKRINFDIETVEVILGEDPELHNDLSEYKFSEIEILRFTGLYDDEGVEIYTGYIVELHDKIETKTSYRSEVYDMTYRGIVVEGHPAHENIGVGGIRNLDMYCDYGFGGKYNVSCKVVGTKYE